MKQNNVAMSRNKLILTLLASAGPLSMASAASANEAEAAAPEAGSSSAVVQASAQAAAAAKPADTGEIVVSARRREESIQDAPLSISAFTSEQIEQAGIFDFDDVARLTPSLVFDTHFGAQDTRPTIRGLPATRGRPPIGILLNGVDVSSEAVATAGGGNLLNLQLLDLERIEVAKGPQSALYGRVAFGGAVNYITKRPTDTFEGNIGATVASHDQYAIRAAIGGPLTEGFNVRVNAAYSEGDGFYRNEVSGERIGGYENTQFGFAADFDKGGSFTASFDYIYSDGRQEQPAYYQYSLIDGSASPFALPANVAGQTFGNLTLPASISALPAGPLEGRDEVSVSVDPRTGEDYTGSFVRSHFATLKLNYEIGNVLVTSTTGYLNADSGVFQDIDGYGLPLTQVALPAPGGLGEPLPFLFEFAVDTNTEQFSQNLQVGDLQSEGFRWAVGGLYWREEVNQDNGTFAAIMLNPTASAGLNTVLADNPTIISRDDGRETDHWSIYGFAEIDITDRLTLGVEARYADESYLYDFTTSQLALGAGTTPVATRPGAPGQRGIEFGESTFAPKFFAQYDASDDVMIYASAAKGVKPGGISTVGTFNNVEDNAYAAETLWNYEIGVKSALFDNAVLFNVAGFYMDYTDKQVSVLTIDDTQPSGFRAVIENASAARVYGLEVDTRIAFSDSLSLFAAYTFLDAKYSEFDLVTRTAHNIAFGGNCEIVEVGTGTQSTNCLVDLSGNRLERAPKHSASATLTYQTPISDSLDFTAEFALQYQSERFLEDLNAQTFDEFATADLRFSVASESWTITAYVDNLFDDDTVKSGFTQGDFSGLFTSPGARSFVLNAPDPIRGGVRMFYRF